METAWTDSAEDVNQARQYITTRQNDKAQADAKQDDINRESRNEAAQRQQRADQYQWEKADAEAEATAETALRAPAPWCWEGIQEPRS